MQNEVKNRWVVTRAGLGHSGVPSFGWILYFFLSIGVVGFVFSYLMALPLCLAGRLWPSLWKLGGRIQAKGVAVLLDVQPWFHADVQIDLPRPKLGQRGFITMSNHRSHLDMFILLSRIPNLRAITKRDLLGVPFLNIMIVALKMIPVRRKDAGSFLTSMETARRAVDEGDVVHVFPEMSRCPSGMPGTADFALLPFRMAQQANVPIFPIVIEGTDQSWPKETLGIRFGCPIKVRTLSAIIPADFENANSLRLEVKKRIDEALMSHGT